MANPLSTPQSDRAFYVAWPSSWSSLTSSYFQNSGRQKNKSAEFLATGSRLDVLCRCMPLVQKDMSRQHRCGGGEGGETGDFVFDKSECSWIFLLQTIEWFPLMKMLDTKWRRRERDEKSKRGNDGWDWTKERERERLASTVVIKGSKAGRFAIWHFLFFV